VDRDLRIPFIMSDESIDLIRKMLDRDLATRPTMAKVLVHPVLPLYQNFLIRSGSLMSSTWTGRAYDRANRAWKSTCFLREVEAHGVIFNVGVRLYRGHYRW
jgi:serine/threonine protein kinase